MEELFDRRFFQELPPLRFLGSAAGESAMAGLRKSNARGSSVEFSDFREYLPGDDVRRLDWNAYARLGKLYMKLYREEREGIFSLYLDLSPSMNYGTEVKARQVLRVAAVLSYMALENQDRVRLHLCGFPESVGIPLHQSFHRSTAFSRLLTWLENAEEYRQKRQAEGTSGKQPAQAYPEGHTSRERLSLWEQLHRFPPDLGGTSILLSDFMPEDVTEQVKYLRLFRKQTVLLLQVLAEEELHPVFAGTSELIDMEEDARMRITLTPGLLRTYQKELETLQRKLVETAGRYQCHYQCICASEPAAAFLQKGMNRYWQHR